MEEQKNYLPETRRCRILKTFEEIHLRRISEPNAIRQYFRRTRSKCQRWCLSRNAAKSRSPQPQLLNACSETMTTWYRDDKSSRTSRNGSYFTVVYIDWNTLDVVRKKELGSADIFRKGAIFSWFCAVVFYEWSIMILPVKIEQNFISHRI